MLRAVRLEDGQVRAGGRDACAPGARLFVDASPDPEHVRWLGERFGFHPLALEDCVHEDQRTKFDEYAEALFLVLHRITPAATEDGLNLVELHVFLTSDALVTVHSAPIAELDRVFERCSRDPQVLARGPDHALYLVLDAITDAHFDLADYLTNEIEELASAVVEQSGAREDLMERLLTLRRMHAQLRRRLAPQRDVVAALARPREGRVEPRIALYFRDVLDHLLRVTEEIDVGRDLLGSVMDVHLSLVNNRLTLVTARLALVATVFLPLNFIAGWFGMNLEILPIGVSKALAIGATLALPPALWWWFRRKRLL